MKPGMVKGLMLVGLLVLLCHQVAVRAHTLREHNPPGNVDKLKSLLQLFEEALAAEENSEDPADYEERNMTPGQNPASAARERTREEQSEEGGTDEGLEAQRKHLIDLLLSTRSKNYSGCFGGKLDRIGSGSLGCNAMRG